MSRSDDHRFRIRPGTPKQRGDRFIIQVLRQASKAGAKSGAMAGRQPGAQLGRGHVAARFSGAKMAPIARRLAIKARLVKLVKAGPRSTAAHLRYIEPEAVDRKGGPGRA